MRKSWLWAVALGIAVASVTLVVDRRTQDGDRDLRGAGLPAAVRPGDGGAFPSDGPIAPSVVDLRTLPTVDRDPRAAIPPVATGEKRPESPISEAEAERLREAAVGAAPQLGIRPIATVPSLAAPSIVASFQALTFDDDPSGVPPDPEMAAGPDHLIAVVNSVFEIYDKSGSSVAGPFLFDTFFTGVAGCTGTFDPNVLYDEKENRFFLGIDAGGGDDNNGYCMAVTQTGDPTGAWNRYSFDATANAADFFDYPHAGVGDQAIFMGGNLFGPAFHADVWAIDKFAMYAGSPLPTPVRKVLTGTDPDTPQPMNAHGFLQGTWPTGNVHYILGDDQFNGSSIGVWRWTDPFGANQFTQLGVINLNAETGVTGGFPIDTPIGGTSRLIQANDFRIQDAEYRNGSIFMTQTISVNPGGGTVNAVRWAEIDPDAPGGPDFVQGGVISSAGQHRIFGDLAVNHCNDVTVGYTRTNGSTNPAVYFTGRLGTDPANTTQAEAQLKAGEVVYNAFDGSPHRWGDYTGLTSDPDGNRFWYLGEYAANTTSTFADWGTWIGGFDSGCGFSADISLDQPTPPNLLQVCGDVTLTGTGFTAGTVLKAYLSTASGPADVALAGIAPTAVTPTQWQGTLPCPFEAPFGLTAGQGFLGLQLVRTDLGFDTSEVVGIPLVGNPGQGVPSVLAINGNMLDDSSWMPSIGLANVNVPLPQSSSVTVDGEGFSFPVVNVFTATGNCGPITPSSSSASTLSFTMPPSCPTGPGSIQVVNTDSFLASNAVSARIGTDVAISSVSVSGSTVTVNGAGFSPVTVINLFAQSSGGVTNFGGLSGSTPNLPITFVNETQFTFQRPGGALAGAAFVEAINPPFIPTSSSGNDPDGAFSFP